MKISHCGLRKSVFILDFIIQIPLRLVERPSKKISHDTTAEEKRAGKSITALGPPDRMILSEGNC